MSRTEYMGLVAVAIVVLSAAGALAAEPPKMDAAAQERAARAEQMLAQTREELTRLERDVARAREVSPEPPRRMLAQLERARGRAHAAEVAARGLHWRVARPILAEVKRVIGEADRLETLLQTPPPRPPMPVGMAPTGTGSISGTVTDAASGLPLAGVQVRLQAMTYPYAEFDAATDAGGDFLFTGLGMGVYRLWTRGTAGYLDEVFSDAPCADGECSFSLPTGTVIALEDGQIRTALDFALQPAASISGSLVGLGGEPVAGAEVFVYDLIDYAYNRHFSTDTMGEFDSGDMWPGTYFLVAHHPNYLDELYDNFSCQPDCIPQAGTPITLAPSQALTGLSFVLTPSGKVAGSVTSADTGEDVSSYMIALYDQELKYVNSLNQSSRDYELRDIAPGNYFVSVHPFYGGYVSEVFDDIHCTPECDIGAGTPITVAAGATTAGIDFALEKWGRIGGVLTASESGYPLSGGVEVYDSSGYYMLWTASGESGDWLAGGLGDGTYFAIADTDERLAEVWDGLPCEPECDPTAGTPIPIAIGTLTEGIDFSLDLGGWISGTVTRRANGTPIQNVHVRVFDEAGEQVASTFSGPLGRFVAKGLPSGTYTAVASEDSSYEYDEYGCQMFDDLPCEGAEGTPIAVTAGAGTGGVDFALRRLASISGRVTSAATGEALLGSVQAYDSEGQFVRSGQVWEGRYRISSLDPGTYFVKTYVYDANEHYQDEVWDDIPCDSSACDVTTGTPVLVAFDQEIGDIDFALMRRGSLSGTVTETGSGQAIPDAQVYVYDSVGSFVRSGQPNSAGAFVFAALPAGTYFVKVLSSNHVDELYDNIPCESSCSITGGTPVPVEVGQDSSGVDFVLDRRGSISGRVTDESTGFGIRYASVSLYSASGGYLQNAYSSGTGEYTLIGLGSGTYYVRASSDGYTAELYDDIPCPYSCDVTSGVPITVVDGQDTPGIDLALASSESGGSVKGRVVGFDGLGLPSVSVRLYDTAGTQVTSTTTDGLGYYQSPNLSNGSYFVVAGSTTHLDELYDNLPCEGGCDVTGGTAVTVSSGAVTENINFALDPTGRILGRLLDAVSGRPLEGGWVTIYDGTGVPVALGVAGGDGHYSAWGLVTGTYFAVAKSSGYVSELFDNIPCPVTCDVTTGQPVAVTAGQPTNGIDFSLTPGGGIAGRVIDHTTGAGVEYAGVRLYSVTGAPITWSETSNGYFYFPWQPAGTYYVTASANGYIGQLYAGRECEPSCDVTVGTPVVVTNGAITNDINFSMRTPYFADVPVEYWSRRYIESLYAAGVTAGCSVDPPLYCPTVTVSRAQAAPLLLRSDEGSGYLPPPAVGVFDDVPVESGFAPWIEELALRGITAGCSVDPPLYCPEMAVTRAQMAVFLLKTLEGEGYEPPLAVGTFEDVPVEDPFAPWIEEIARRGITAGCSAVPPLYCPNSVVARDQIAVFLVKAFNLPPAL